MKRIMSVILLMVFAITSCTVAWAKGADIDPYTSNVVLETCDERTYKDNANGWCGGGGDAYFYDVDFGSLGAKGLEIGIGWAGATITPIYIKVFDGDDASNAETILTVPKGVTSTNYSVRTAYTYDLNRVITGTHNLHITSANGVNFYDIKFIQADPKETNLPVYTEDFNDELDSSMWTTEQAAGALDGQYSRGGTAYKFSGNKHDIVYNTSSYPNHVYEVWMYYKKDTYENKQVKVTGTNSENNSLTHTIAAHLAYDNFIVNGAQTSVKKTEGWHKLVIDCSSDEKTDFYIDGVMVKSFTTTNAISSVVNFELEDGSDSAVWYDDFKIYESYSDVPSFKTDIIESALFESGIEADGAKEVTKADGKINISYEVSMKDITAANFALYEKEASAYDSTYTLVENGFSLETTTDRQSVIAFNNLQSVKKYRFYMNGLTAVSGSVMDNSFIEFSTGNVNSRAGTLYYEDFNDALTDGWTVTKFSQNSEKSHSLSGSYYSYQGGSSIKFDTEAYPNSIYEVWYYYNKDTSTQYEHKEMIVADESGSFVSLLAHSSWESYIVKYKAATDENAHSSYTSIPKKEGWNRVLIDCVDANAVKIYVNNELLSTVDASFSSVSEIRLENGVDTTQIWYDDLKIYDAMEYVPAFTQEIIEVIVFDNGTEVKNAENVGVYDGNINVNYVGAMKNISADNFMLYKKSAASTTDADYQLVENGISVEATSTEIKSVISVADLQPSTKYRLYFTGLTNANNRIMAEDFIEFTTADNVNLLDNVVDKISFDNGIIIPTSGIPSAISGDLTVEFTEEMDKNTLTDKTILLEKLVENEAAETIAYTAELVSGKYVISSEDMNLETASTYKLTVTENVFTTGRNHLNNAQSFEFSTSSDGIKQEPVITDDLENISDNWSIEASEIGETAHSGSYAISLSEGQINTYNGKLIPNGVYEIWFYDTALSTDSMLLKLEGKNAQSIQFGIKAGFADKYWISGDVLVGKRSKGWHRFIVDTTADKTVDYYIDDVLVYTLDKTIDSILGISLSGNALADDFKIWNLMDYEVISKIVENKAFICDASYNTVLDYAAGDEVYIAISVDNQQKNEQAAVLVVGEYKNGVLTRVIPGSSAIIPAGQSQLLRADYTIPENFADYELKAFCWDSLSSMKPLMPVSNPKEKTVVFLGGALTAQNDGYVNGVGEYFKAAYGENAVKVINSGVNSKGSAFGAKYFDTYVGANNPDILFVEYVGEDATEAEIPVKKHIEQIVQKALNLPKKPQLVFVYADENSAKAWHSEVAEYYNIPEIDLTSAGDYVQTITQALETEGFLRNIEMKEAKFIKDTVAVNTNIMSFNICVGGLDTNNWSYRKEAVLDFINNSDADVISMQEVSPSQYEYISENIDAKYEVIHYIREDSTAAPEGLAIAYNTENYELVSNERFWLSETPEIPSGSWNTAFFRICVNALLKHKETGEMLDIYNVHLDHESSQAREKGIELVAQRAIEKGYKSAVMGDFNFHAESSPECYAAINDYMLDCQISAVQTENGKTFHNFGADTTSTTPIDYIFVNNDNMKPLAFDICTEQWTNENNELKYYSDHYAIKANVEITYNID